MNIYIAKELLIGAGTTGTAAHPSTIQGQIALVSRFAWPSVGGTQQVVRTLATALVGPDVDIQIYAQRIDNDGTGWKGPLDRARPWSPVVDPASGVTTIQLRIGTREWLRLGPLLGSSHRAAARSSLYAAYHHWLDRRLGPIVAPTLATQLRDAAIVHRFGGNPMTAGVMLAAKALGVPAVVTPLAHRGDWDDDAVSAHAYRQADLVVATTRTDAELYASLGVRPEALTICPLPTREPLRGGGKRVRATAGLDGPVVTFIGDRRPYKGVPELLAAWPDVRRRHPDATLVFIGPGGPLPPDQAGVADLGMLPDDDRDGWLEASDVVCLPSSSESFGLTISEAWSAGTPVVTSDLPVLAERVNDVGGGLAVPKQPEALGEAIHSLLADPALRRTMGNAGYRHWLATSTPERYAEFHLKAYRRLLNP